MRTVSIARAPGVPSVPPSTAADTEPAAAETVPSAPDAAPPAELDAATQRLLADAIAKAVAGKLGRVRISSIPPEPPRSSIRVAASVAASQTSRATRIGMAVLGAAAVVGEFVAANYPHAIGPLHALCRVALRLLEGGASP